MQDKLTIKAKREGYRARSVFKLQQIHDRYKILKRKADVLDIGCWPGSWLQFVKENVEDGYFLGVDKLKIAPIEGVHFLQSDLFDESLLDKILEKNTAFDIILSDIAPETTGQISLDQGRSAVMVEVVLELAYKLLKKNGRVLIKIFQSNEANEILKTMKNKFRIVKIVKPQATKKRSKEMYFLGLGFR